MKAQTLAEENARLKGELQREYVFGERRMRRSTQLNERLRRALEGAQKEITVNVLANMSATELSKTAVAEREEMRKRTDAELEAHHDELNERRQRQYVLTSQLLDAKDQAYRLENQFESLIEQRNDETERAEELEARLENAVADLEETETALEQTHSAHAADVAARAVVKIKSKPRTRGASRRPRCSPRSPSGGACASGTKSPRRRRRRERDGASGRGRRQKVIGGRVARHLVRKQAEACAARRQLDRTRLVLGRTRHKLTATLNHPPAMQSVGVTKERRGAGGPSRSSHPCGAGPTRQIPASGRDGAVAASPGGGTSVLTVPSTAGTPALGAGARLNGADTY